MRNSVFAIALLVLTLACGSVWAADPVASTYNWTGFYVGLNTGLSCRRLRLYADVHRVILLPILFSFRLIICERIPATSTVMAV